LVEGTITRLTKFGAFARLEGDLEGLIHISEISENRIEHPKEAGLHDGSVVTLRIIRIDPEQRRIGLSLRKVDSGAYKDLDLKQLDLEGVTLDLVDQDPGETVPVPAENQEPVDLEAANPEPVEQEPGEVVPLPADEEVTPVPAEDQEPVDLEAATPEPVEQEPGEVITVPAKDQEPLDLEDATPEPAETEPSKDGAAPKE
jgi:hypothetical protein